MSSTAELTPEEMRKGLNELANKFRRLIDSTIHKLKQAPDQGKTTKVFMLVWKRLQQGLHVMELLDKEPDTSFEKAVILRALYDFHLQQLHLLTDVPKFAEDYMDFAYVEQAEMIEIIDRADTQFAQSFQNQPEYVARSKDRLADYNKVKHRFQTKNKTSPKSWRNWYGTDLSVIVRPEYRHEYKFFTRQLNQVVHGSSIVLPQGPTVAEPAYINDTLVITVRVLTGIAKYLGVQFSPEEQELIGQATQSLII